jgi:hypothetical protein
MTDHSDKRLVLVPGPAQTASELTGRPERRKSIRYPFTAEVEAVETRSQVRIAGRTSDLALGGCYIDTISTLPAGAIVRLRIKREQRVFEALATVANSHASMGMGMAFTEIKPEHQVVLRAWLSELSGEQLPEAEIVETEPETSDASTILHLQQVLNELINLMVRKKIINDKEGAALLRQLFR